MQLQLLGGRQVNEYVVIGGVGVANQGFRDGRGPGRQQPRFRAVRRRSNIPDPSS